LITHLESGETPIEALARLGKNQKKEKKIPAWKLKKRGKSNDAMETDTDQKRHEDPEQARIKVAIEEITGAADKLLSRDYVEIYDQERELLIREYKKDTGEDWVEPLSQMADSGPGSAQSQSWEFRWTDGRDGGTVQGPFDGPTMKAWQDAGYFGEGVEFRSVGGDEGWTRLASFV
jgi:CD2 antigen cytoplasmic tail-binding protein 2